MSRAGIHMEAANLPDDVPVEVVRKLAYNPAEAAEALGISTRTLWSLTSSGEVPHVKLRGRVLYPVRALETWLEKRSGSDNR